MMFYISTYTIIKIQLGCRSEPRRIICDVNYLMLLQVTSKEIHGPCDIIDEAIKRYPKRIFPPAAANVYSHLDPLHRKQRRREARREMKTDPM